MSQFHAVTWQIKPGSEDKVAEIFADYPRLDRTVIEDADGKEIGRLISTAVFLKDDRIVRVIEFEGALPDVMRHMASRRTMHQLENRLAEHLLEQRDTSSPDAFRDFFLRASMRVLFSARAGL